MFNKDNKFPTRSIRVTLLVIKIPYQKLFVKSILLENPDVIWYTTVHPFFNVYTTIPKSPNPPDPIIQATTEFWELNRDQIRPIWLPLTKLEV